MTREPGASGDLRGLPKEAREGVTTTFKWLALLGERLGLDRMISEGLLGISDWRRERRKTR